MNRAFDISTMLGILTAMALVTVAILMGGVEHSKAFIDMPSAMIVVGGTYFLTTACFTLSDVWKAKGLIVKTLFQPSESPSEAATLALKIADIARKKGILELQNHPDLIDRNVFLRRGLSLIMDGIQPPEAEHILIQEIAGIAERHRKGASILQKAAEIAPSMGLIGTLIGLVQMLGNLSDPSTIGPAMAVALLTTLYGALLSYVILSPLAAKLEASSKLEVTVMKIYLNAVLSIGKKENPRRLEILINAILPPAMRVKYFS